MQVAVDPANLVLARRPVAGHRMHVTVDQPRSQRRAFGIDGQGGAFDIDVFLPSHGGDLSVDCNHGIGVEDRLLQVAAQQQADVPDHKAGLGFTFDGLILGHEAHLVGAKSSTCSGLLCELCGLALRLCGKAFDLV